MPIEIKETEKEGHRKVRTPNLKKRPKGKRDLYGTMTYKKGGRTRKQLGGGFNQPLAGAAAPIRPPGFKHGKSVKKKKR